VQKVLIEFVAIFADMSRDKYKPMTQCLLFLMLVQLYATKIALAIATN